MSQLLASGEGIIAVGTKLSVAKFGADGSPDASFSFDPLDSAPEFLQVGYEEVVGARLDRSDNLIIAGQYDGNRGWMPWLTKVNPVGKLALPFANKGYWIPKRTKGIRTFLNEIAVDRAGRIYLAVVRVRKNRGLVTSSIQRLTPNGRADSNFADTSSKRVLKRQMKRGYASLDGLTVTNGGRIVYSISAPNGPIVRALRPDGTQDRSFGRNGTVRVNQAFSVAKLTSSGDRVLLWGNLTNHSPQGTFTPYALALRSSGDLISSFGKNGRVTVGASFLASAKITNQQVITPATLSIDDKDRAIASFNVGSGLNAKARMTTVRLDRRGRLDRSFGDSGVFQAPVVYDSENSSVTLEDGSVVVDAGAKENGSVHPALFRLLP